MRIFISAGHSNDDPGAVANGQTEAAIVADFRNMVAFYLREVGHEVVTDGVGTVNQTLSQALKHIPGSDLAVEFHCNAAGSQTAKGVESISLPPLKGLSQRLSAAIASVLGSPLRGDKGWIDQKQSARGSLAFVNAGGVIVELFFLSNPQELAVYQAKKWLVAKAVAAVMKEGR
ncbi:N-acetylmuramoyl-L-alanine amidase [Neisseriaceae bacterium TC5R-5]|nr:N-acetylmuramoyl-L-alanine amidase [Neisseriaceae bacterium TC5R-5]